MKEIHYYAKIGDLHNLKELFKKSQVDLNILNLEDSKVSRKNLIMNCLDDFNFPSTFYTYYNYRMISLSYLVYNIYTLSKFSAM